ncbi:trypsin-like cysteine/serine peptidase domain-containing protein, partial [Bombardia bombarda]
MESRISPPPIDPAWNEAHGKARLTSVAIHNSHLVPYDTTAAAVCVGSGNLVNQRLGLVLTNRHIAGDGPSAGYASFKESHKYRIQTVYRDPGHDFAFVGLRTDSGRVPEDLPEALSLAPHKAKQGIEIHRVSNEPGVGGNIGQGFVVRTNCTPPETVGGGYQDFNTEYISLAMVAPGGSSGSVAVDIQGDGIGLTCSSSELDCFMLPLDLPLRALKKLEKGEFVTRGTLQTRWALRSARECEMLGLAASWLERFRAEKVGHLLCAVTVLADGPTDDKVEPGDLLLALDGELVTSLLQVEAYMDDHVHEDVELTCWAALGGRAYQARCTIEDLHALTPSHIVRWNGTVFHDLPLNTAMQYDMPARGV